MGPACSGCGCAWIYHVYLESGASCTGPCGGRCAAWQPPARPRRRRPSAVQAAALVLGTAALAGLVLILAGIWR